MGYVTVVQEDVESGLGGLGESCIGHKDGIYIIMPEYVARIR